MATDKRMTKAANPMAHMDPPFPEESPVSAHVRTSGSSGTYWRVTLTGYLETRTMHAIRARTMREALNLALDIVEKSGFVAHAMTCQPMTRSDAERFRL